MSIRAEYLRDLPMAVGTRLTKRGRPEHWLHPIHGPSPDLIGLVTWSTSEFLCAVWPLVRSFVVMLERINEEEPTTARGGIVQSYRWIVSEKRLVNSDHGKLHGSIHIGHITEETEEATRHHIYRQLMIESVMLAVLTTIGGFRNGS
jgi:hypothetical protein